VEVSVPASDFVAFIEGKALLIAFPAPPVTAQTPAPRAANAAAIAAIAPPLKPPVVPSDPVSVVAVGAEAIVSESVELVESWEGLEAS
jgi:hypothetical protein